MKPPMNQHVRVLGMVLLTVFATLVRQEQPRESGAPASDVVAEEPKAQATKPVIPTAGRVE